MCLLSEHKGKFSIKIFIVEVSPGTEYPIQTPAPPLYPGDHFPDENDSYSHY
jgi:hypothetical protein